jgi:hypothetical protein
VQNRLNLVAVLRMGRAGTSGTVLGRVGSPDFDVPTTVAKFFDRVYLPNARFGADPPATRSPLSRSRCRGCRHQVLEFLRAERLDGDQPGGASTGR